MADGQHIGGSLDFARNLGRRTFAGAQSESDVVEHRHVRVERIVLKHHGDVTVLGRHVVDTLPGNRKAALIGIFESGNGSQQCAFAATGLADQHSEFTCRYGQVYAFDHMVVAIVFV